MRKILIMFLLGLFNATQAYICQAVIMRKQVSDAGCYHYVLGLGDYHDAVLPEDEVQRSAVGSWLKMPHNKGLRVIVEDLNAPNVEGRIGAKGLFLERPQGKFLGGIAHVCRAAGAEVINLEYRYARLIAFGSKSNALAQAVLVSDLIQEVESELSCIKRFSDGHALSTWYAHEVIEIQSAMQSFDWAAHAATNVCVYAESLSRSCIDRLILFDKAILDMKMVHDIVHCVEADRTCIIAGFSHIERVEVQLKNIGYEVVSRIDANYSLRGAVGSAFSSEYSPLYPIDSSKLLSFLNQFS